MEKMNNEKTLDFYIRKFRLDEVFEKDMRKFMEIHSFNKGEPIYRSSVEIDYFYFLVKGVAKVYTITKNGKALLLRFYKPLEIMGDLEFLGERASHCNVEAIDEVLLIGISFENLMKNAQDDIKFLKYLSKTLAEKLRTSSDSSTLNLLYPLENRLASYILALANDSKYLNEDEHEIEMFKLKDIAELLGSSYRHLLRTIDLLSNKKIIERKRNHIRILERKQLEELAKDLYE